MSCLLALELDGTAVVRLWGADAGASSGGAAVPPVPATPSRATTTTMLPATTTWDTATATAVPTTVPPSPTLGGGSGGSASPTSDDDERGIQRHVCRGTLKISGLVGTAIFAVLLRITHHAVSVFGVRALWLRFPSVAAALVTMLVTFAAGALTSAAAFIFDAVCMPVEVVLVLALSTITLLGVALIVSVVASTQAREIAAAPLHRQPPDLTIPHDVAEAVLDAATLYLTLCPTLEVHANPEGQDP